MTKKHFRELAKGLHANKPSDFTHIAYDRQRDTWEDCVRVIADVCAQANPRFDRDKFLTACREGL